MLTIDYSYLGPFCAFIGNYFYVFLCVYFFDRRVLGVWIRLRSGPICVGWERQTRHTLMVMRDNIFVLCEN